MISSAIGLSVALREPQPPATATGYESPRAGRDAGWLGQVPPAAPPTPPAAPRGTATSSDDALPMTGHGSVRDAREAGWLGQVPPAATTATDSPPTSTRPAAEIEFDNETAHERRERGWLGQVPPPSPPPAEVDEAPATTYANPQLAPEPWKDSGSLFPNDPTLFG